MTDVPVIPMASQKDSVTDKQSKKKVTIVPDQTVFPKKKKKDKKDKKKEKEKKKEDKKKEEEVKPSLENDDDSGDKTVRCTIDLQTKQLSRNGQYRIDALNNKRLVLWDWMEDLQDQNKVSIQTMFFALLEN